MFDYERKPIYKGSLNTFISTIIKHICMSGLVSSECAAALIVASLGPGAGCEGGGGVTRHTLHSALRANCSPAAAGLHEMAGHTLPLFRCCDKSFYLLQCRYTQPGTAPLHCQNGYQHATDRCYSLLFSLPPASVGPRT